MIRLSFALFLAAGAASAQAEGCKILPTETIYGRYACSQHGQLDLGAVRAQMEIIPCHDAPETAICGYAAKREACGAEIMRFDASNRICVQGTMWTSPEHAIEVSYLWPKYPELGGREAWLSVDIQGEHPTLVFAEDPMWMMMRIPVSRAECQFTGPALCAAPTS